MTTIILHGRLDVKIQQLNPLKVLTRRRLYKGTGLLETGVPNMLLASEDIKQKQNERTKSKRVHSSGAV